MIRERGEDRAPHDLRLVPAALTIWLAALLGLLTTWWAALLVAGLAGIAAAVLIGRGRAGMRGVCVTLVVAAALTAWPISTVIRGAEHDPLGLRAQHGGTAEAQVTVTERPRPVRGSTGMAAPGDQRSWLIPSEAESVSVYDEAITTSGRVLLIGHEAAWKQVLPGQSLVVQGALTTPTRSDLTVAVLQVRGPPKLVGESPWWQRGAAAVRADLRDAAGVLDDDEAGLLPGLVVGDTSAMPPRVEQEFRDSGMSHLVAVSGSNVAIICGAVLLLLAAFRTGPRVSAVTAGVVLLAFVVLVGYEPSVLRAGVMGAVGLLALLLGRKGSAMPALAFAVCLLVVLDPAMATNFGFALSVVATAALVLVAPVWAAAMRRRGVPPGVAEALAIPLAAFLATAPIIAGMAGQISLVTVIANILAAPVVAIATVCGALAAFVAPVAPWLAELFVYVAGPAVSWLVWVARQAAAIPGAVVSWPGGWWGGLLAAVLCVGIVIAMRLRSVRAGAVGGCAGVLIIAVPVTTVQPGWPPAGWAMVTCDVGQGDGLVLATGQPGRAVVVDAGTEDGSIDGCLDELDIDRVPLMIVSHLHADHFGGIASVLEGREVGAIAVGPAQTPRWAWEEVADAAAEHDVPMVAMQAGQRLDWPELRLSVLGPRYVSSTDMKDDGTKINNASLVVRADTAAGRILLTGDVELSAQASLVAAGEDLKADVLKVPHHGSRYTSPEFLAAVSPRVAVISVGRGNSFGHPNPAILDSLRALGTRTERTDTSGDIAVVRSPDGPAVVTEGRANSRAPPARHPRWAARSPWVRCDPGRRRASSGRHR